MWDIDLYPATVLEDGTQNRYATGSAQASIYFWQDNKTGRILGISEMVDVYRHPSKFSGTSNCQLWADLSVNSANLEAFKLRSDPREHKEVILEQWQWLQEPAKIPGSYMQSGISNAWNHCLQWCKPAYCN